MEGLVFTLWNVPIKQTERGWSIKDVNLPNWENNIWKKGKTFSKKLIDKEEIMERRLCIDYNKTEQKWKNTYQKLRDNF